MNGTSDLRTAPQLLSFIEDWVKNEGTFLAGRFRLRVVPDCPLQIQSFHQPECMNGEGLSKQNLKTIDQCLDQCVGNKTSAVNRYTTPINSTSLYHFLLLVAASLN